MCSEPAAWAEDAPRQGARTPWRKVLYLKQPFEDNHVDESFLDSLVLNLNVRRYEYSSLLLGTTMVVQQLSLVSIFASIWSRVQAGVWDHGWLLLVDALLLLLGYGLGAAIGCWQEPRGPAALAREAAADVCYGIRVLAPLWVTSPMLMTLTRTWSDDTIATMTFVLLAAHVSRHEYTTGHSGGGTASAVPGGAVAINAAMLAATILASRLESVDQVFAFMSFAMEVFAFLPRLSARLRHHAPRGHALAVTPLLALAAAQLLGSRAAARLLLAALAAIGLLGPALLVWAQRYKAEIGGPWDIAHVSVSPAPPDG